MVCDLLVLSWGLIVYTEPGWTLAQLAPNSEIHQMGMRKLELRPQDLPRFTVGQLVPVGRYPLTFSASVIMVPRINLD